MKFRSKPVIIEAWDTHQVIISATSHWPDVPQPIRDAYERGEVVFGSDYVSIKTLEGTMRAEPSDKIIQGTKGELYPCKADIFAFKYEAV